MEIAQGLKAPFATRRVVKKRADKGGFQIKNLAPGVYRVSIAKNGYTEQVRSVPVSDGETSEVNFELVRR